MKTQVDKKKSKALAYTVRDLIWLSMDNLHLPHTLKKLLKCWLGPYKITRTIGLNVVKLLLSKSICIHPIVNISGKAVQGMLAWSAS